MGEEDAFLRAILDRPSDAARRLVYADWLEERGDPRAEYLRLCCALRAEAVPEDDRPAALARAKALRKGFDPAWLLQVDRAGIGAGAGKPPGAGQRRVRRREVTEADLSLFIRQYARKAHRGHDPNDRGYCREVEKRVKRMRPEEVDRLIRGEEET